MEEGSVCKKRQSTDLSGLTDDLLVDILSRVPVKTLCCCKCVSPSWRDLISHPDHRKKLPQTLLGFFYFADFKSCKFVSLVPPSEGKPRPPSPVDFSFLPEQRQVLDRCNGLVLLKCWFDSGSARPGTFVVCNPATKKWVTVPKPTETGKDCTGVRLCFDPAISSHFHVVRLLHADENGCWTEPEEQFAGYEIYSSDTGHWVFCPDDGGWSPLCSSGTYFNGVLHFISCHQNAVVALDIKRQTDRTIYLPQNKGPGFIGHSQGRLFYANKDDRNAYRILIYALEDYDSDKWTLKHSINSSDIYASARQHLQSALSLGIAAIHPHCNLIYLFDCSYGTLIYYNMDNRSIRDIRTIPGTCSWSFAPYVPFYLEISALEKGN